MESRDDLYYRVRGWAENLKNIARDIDAERYTEEDLRDLEEILEKVEVAFQEW